MKYIGPFLRINSLNKENIKSQLFHLSKENIKNIVMKSGCGIKIPFRELKFKSTPEININTFNSFSPLVCIYKKASSKLINIGNKLCWDEDTFKKEIIVSGNGLMTLCLLELSDYYETFKDKKNEKYSLSKIYRLTAQKQIEFYSSYLRNDEGVFVDKKDISDDLSEKIALKEKNKKFKFSDQALMMAAFYKLSTYEDIKQRKEFADFSEDILKMFFQYKNELYSLSNEELSKLCLYLNIYYSYSKNEKAKYLLEDIAELYIDNCKHGSSINENNKLENELLMFLNSSLLYKNTSVLKFKDIYRNIFDKLAELYSPEKGIFIKDTESKEVVYSCGEIVLYLLSIMVYSKLECEDKNSNILLVDIFKRQLVESEIILSWPEAPSPDDIERYKNFSLKPEDLLDSQYFKMPTIQSPETSEIASVFIKNVTFNKKKEEFKHSKTTFDSSKNLFLFFMIIYVLKLTM